MKYSSAQQRQQKLLLFAGIVGFTVLVGIVIGLFIYRQKMMSDFVYLDEQTLCPAQSGPNSYTAILIDGSDGFNAIQFSDLIRYLQSVKASIPTGGLVAVYAPRTLEQTELLKSVLKICNPGSAEEVSSWNRNPRQIRLRYEEGFSNKLDSALQDGLDAQGNDTSPIMEMIQAVAIDAFPANSESMPKKLVIISDMLHNTSDYSQYDERLEFNEVITRAFFSHVTADLRGVNVSILYIARRGSEKLQTRGHILFWENYFRTMGGNLTLVQRIGG